MLRSEPIRKSALKAVGDQPFKEWEKHLNIRKRDGFVIPENKQEVC